MHRARGHSKRDINYLKLKGFKEFEAKSISSSKREKFLIKPRYNEGLPHAFLTFDLAAYIKKNLTKDIKVLETKGPDIIFKINGKVCAIEVESGSLLKTNRNALLKKIRSLNKTYGKNWFFVVADRKLASSYARLGPATESRYVKWWIKKIAK